MTPIAQQLADDKARSEAAGIPFNPRLPPHFDNTPNEERPPLHQPWWHRPFITTETVDAWDAREAARSDSYAEESRKRWAESDRAKWMEAWPSGIRYDVRCLDGGAWDRSTNWGMFATLDDAFACVAAGPTWQRAHRDPSIADRPRASVITEALRAYTARLLGGPTGPGADDWSRLDQAMALIADDLTSAIDDRPTTCEDCGARRSPAHAPPLAELAERLRHPPPIDPAYAPGSEGHSARRFAQLLWILGSLLGQCERHGADFDEMVGKHRD